MSKTKVLILHMSVGHGIKATARNIYEQLSESEDYEPRIEDCQALLGERLPRRVEKVYLAILERFSFLWGAMYSSTVFLGITMPLRKFLAGFKSSHVLKLLREFQPAIVISTQTVPTGIVAYLKAKGLYRGKLVAVFSDFHLQKFWMYKEVDLYLCAIEDQVKELLALGVSKDKIALTGLFIARKFNNPIDKDEAKQELGLLTSMPVVLLTSGARVRHQTIEIFLKLLRSPISFQIAVICGLNEELKNELKKISSPSNHPVKIFGYVENMEKLMSASDVLLGKPGGPTTGEAIIKKLPMVLTDARPGHEALNLEYLMSNNIVQYGRIPREAVFLVEQILDGKLKTNWESAYEKLLKSKNGTNLVEALGKIMPESEGLTVKNYQEV